MDVPTAPTVITTSPGEAAACVAPANVPDSDRTRFEQALSGAASGPDTGVVRDQDTGVARNQDTGVPRNQDAGVPRDQDTGVARGQDTGQPTPGALILASFTGTGLDAGVE